MHGICYKNTQTNFPSFPSDYHIRYPYGYAYESNTHFIHYYGVHDSFYSIENLSFVSEGKSGSLTDWVKRIFGAHDINPLSNKIGEVVEGIWRPGFCFFETIPTALNIDLHEQMSSGQALRNIINKIDELLLYIEPSMQGLQSYGHKSRELLILACTEVENQWASLIKKSNLYQPNNNKQKFTTNDYVKLLDQCHFNEYQIEFKNYAGLKFVPFANWSATDPTQSLHWYNAYNKTKHDRAQGFQFATLENVMNAVSACLIMYCVKYGPHDLLYKNNQLSGVINEHFDITLQNSNLASHYIAEVTLPQNAGDTLNIQNIYNADQICSWTTKSLII